jgi:hypothetical protein
MKIKIEQITKEKESVFYLDGKKVPSIDKLTMIKTAGEKGYCHVIVDFVCLDENIRYSEDCVEYRIGE